MIRLFGDICQAIFCHIDFPDVTLLANHIIIGSGVFGLRIKVFADAKFGSNFKGRKHSISLIQIAHLLAKDPLSSISRASLIATSFNLYFEEISI